MAKADILLLGATGYTGALVARYLASHPERKSFSFALGGRSHDKLQKVAQENGLNTKEVKLIEVDVLDQHRVCEVVKDFRVVLTAVGPYWKYGKYVVQACAEANVHYVDLCGEPSFMLWCIENYDYLASKNHTRVVIAGGLDSVPSDIGPFLANKTLKKAVGPDTSCGESVSAFEFRMDSISGGSLDAAMDIIGQNVPDLHKTRVEYALSPVKGKVDSRVNPFYRLPQTSVIGAFLPMAPGDQQVVQRTWGLYKLRAVSTKLPEDEGNAYGDEFVYREFLVRKSWLHSLTTNVFWLFAAIVLAIAPLRVLASMWLPKPGEGPSEKSLKEGWVKVTNVTTSVPRTRQEPKIAVKTTIEGEGEPGYLLASVMVAEIALLLLPRNSDKLTEIGKQGGILTPISAFGQSLVDKLEETGRFTFKSEVLNAKQRGLFS